MIHQEIQHNLFYQKLMPRILSLYYLFYWLFLIQNVALDLCRTIISNSVTALLVIKNQEISSLCVLVYISI